MAHHITFRHVADVVTARVVIFLHDAERFRVWKVFHVRNHHQHGHVVVFHYIWRNDARLQADVKLVVPPV